MYDGWKIIIGIIIFVGLIAFPFIYDTGKALSQPDPKVDTPEILKLPEKERKCIETKEFMQREHMQMLNSWRDLVVRDGTTVFTASDGKQYTMSLQNTCMKCHSNKKEFCDECHNYAAVSPYCWDCHIEPKESEL
jgi:hypothetical protein